MLHTFGSFYAAYICPFMLIVHFQFMPFVQNFVFCAILYAAVFAFSAAYFATIHAAYAHSMLHHLPQFMLHRLIFT
jgi:hypothetical protein